MTTNKLFASAALLFAAAGTAHAFDYSESVSGDLPGTLAASGGLNPLELIATPGINSISLGVPAGGDRDYFRFEVPAGYVLSSILHKSYASTDNLSFIGVQGGTQVTVPVPLPMSEFPAAAATLLGYLHFGPTTVDTNILDDLGASGSAVPPAIGFTGSLSAGNYAFWIQQTGVEASYAFDFVLTPVPEPEQWALMLGGGLLLAGRMQRIRSARKVE